MKEAGAHQAREPRYIDVSYFKLSGGVKYVNKDLSIVVGISTNVYREILDDRVADAEHEFTREGKFPNLKQRGLTKGGRNFVEKLLKQLIIVMNYTMILFD